MIAIVDYGCGNLFSLQHALQHVDLQATVVTTRSALQQAQTIILPGVGAFGDAMQALTELGLVTTLQQQAQAGVKIIGICLGMQLLLTCSAEFGMHQGLDLIPGAVTALPRVAPQLATHRLPNMGWRALDLNTADPLWQTRLEGLGMMYFVHSFAAHPSDPTHIKVNTCYNGHAVPAIIQRGNIIGLQFHPEKSASDGLALLRMLIVA